MIIRGGGLRNTGGSALRLLHYWWPLALGWSLTVVVQRATGRAPAADGVMALLCGIFAAYSLDRVLDPPTPSPQPWVTSVLAMSGVGAALLCGLAASRLPAPTRLARAGARRRRTPLSTPEAAAWDQDRRPADHLDLGRCRPAIQRRLVARLARTAASRHSAIAVAHFRRLPALRSKGRSGGPHCRRTQLAGNAGRSDDGSGGCGARLCRRRPRSSGASHGHRCQRRRSRHCDAVANPARNRRRRAAARST